MGLLWWQDRHGTFEDTTCLLLSAMVLQDFSLFRSRLAALMGRGTGRLVELSLLWLLVQTLGAWDCRA